MNKKRKKSNEFPILSIAIMLLVSVCIIVVVTLSGWQRNVDVDGQLFVDQVNSQSDDKQTEMEGHAGTDSLSSSGKESNPYQEKPVIEFTPTLKTDYGVQTDTLVTISHIDDVSADDIQKKLLVDPALKFTVDKLDSKLYQVKFAQAFPVNTVVKMKYEYEGETYGSAFKTEEPFKIKSVYPQDESDYVEQDTILEIKFNRPITKEIEKYIKIEPKIDGEFRIEDDILYFIPAYNLEASTTYVVTIESGYRVKDNELDEEVFSFTTESGNYENYWYLGTQTVEFIAEDTQQFIPFYAWSGNSPEFSDMKVYQVTGNWEDLVNLSHREIIEKIQADGYGEYVKTIPVDYLELNDSDTYIQFGETVPKGFYYVVTSLSNEERGCFIQVSSKNAYVTLDEDHILVWMEDAKSNDHEADIFLNDQKIGRTDSDGLAYISYEVEQETTAFITIRSEEEVLHIPVFVSESYDTRTYEYYSYLYTDRGIYQPTDTIHISGYVKSRQKEAINQVELVFMYGNKELERRTVPVTKMGMYEAVFSVEDFQNRYIDVYVYDQDVCIDKDMISIQSYEKPMYLLHSELDKEYVMDGDTFIYEGGVSYYNGISLTDGVLEIDFSGGDARFTRDSGENIDGYVTEPDNKDTKMNIQVESTSTSWRPNYYTVWTSTRNLDNYYNYSTTGITVFPKDRMIEGTQEKVNDTAFNVDLLFSEIDLSRITSDAYEPDEFRGNPVTDESLTITIKERYYEKKFVRREFNALYKESYDLYDYIKRENTVYKEKIKTDENGRIHILFDQMIEGRHYEVSVQGKDSRGKNINENIDTEYDRDYSSIPYYLVASDSSVGYNEPVDLELLHYGSSIEESEQDKMLLIECRNGINYYHFTDKTAIQIRFDESRIPDTEFVAVYYNGSQMINNYYMSYTVNLNRYSRELKVEIETDKETYDPGETVNYTIHTTDQENNPVQSEMNISVVDEAVFSICEDYSDPLTMYDPNYHPGILGSYLFSVKNGVFFGAECGGEGDTEYVRSDFEDTAYFANRLSDSNGLVTGSFKLPDNLTSWRLTATAFDEEARTVKAKRNLTSGLKFFVDTRVEDQYLIKDDISIGVKSAGDLSLTDQSVAYDIWVTNLEGNILYETTLTDTFGNSNQVKLGQLPLGEYMLNVRGTLNKGSIDEISDRAAYTFSIKNQLAVYQLNVIEPFNPNIELTHNDNFVTLNIFNQEAYNYYWALRRLAFNRYSEQNIKKLSGYIAEGYMDQLFADKEVQLLDSMDDLDVWDNQNSLIKPLSNAQGTYLDTCRLLSIGLDERISDYTKTRFLERAEEDVESEYISEEYIGAQWMLVLLDDPRYDLLNELIENYDLLDTEEEKLMVIQTALDAGLLSKGERLLDKFLWEEDISIQQLGSRLSFDQEKDELFNMMILGAEIKLNDFENAEKIVNYIEKRDKVWSRKYHTSDPELLLYLMRMEKPELETRIKVAYGNTEESKILRYNTMWSLTLSPKEADDFNIIGMQGEPIVNKKYVGNASDLKKLESMVAKKTYIGESEAIHVGDKVIVQLTIERDSDLNSFEIQDVLPAGLTYLDTLATQNVWLSGEVNGQMVNMNLYLKNQGDMKSSSVVTCRYEAIATNAGVYQAEPVYIRESNGESVWVGSNTEIEILE